MPLTDTPTLAEQFAPHPYWQAFRAAVAAGEYEDSRDGWFRFCGFLASKTREGRRAILEDCK